MFKTAEQYTSDIESLVNDFKEVWGGHPVGEPERTVWDKAYEKLIEEEIPNLLPQEFWDRMTADQKFDFIDISACLFESFPDQALNVLELMIWDVLNYGEDFPLIHAIADSVWPDNCEEWYVEVADMLKELRRQGYTITKENK